MSSDRRSLDRAVAKQVHGLRDREAAAVDAEAGREPPERYADLPYVMRGAVPSEARYRVAAAGYWVGWGMSLPTWENPYRPETAWGRLWLEGYEAGRRVRLAQMGRG